MRCVKTYMEETDYEKIKEEAAERNMSISEYIKDRLCKDATVELKIDFADIDSYIAKLDSLTAKVDAALPSLVRTGNATVAAEIQKILFEIRCLSSDTWKFVVDTRTDLYDATRKKLYNAVAANGYKRRKRPKED